MQLWNLNTQRLLLNYGFIPIEYNADDHLTPSPPPPDHTHGPCLTFQWTRGEYMVMPAQNTGPAASKGKPSGMVTMYL